MSDDTPPANRPLSVVTRSGLEVTIPTPQQVSAGLVGFFILLFIWAPFLFMFLDYRGEGMEGWLRTFDQLFGWPWLVVGFLLAVLMIAFHRHSNDHYLISARGRVRFQDRMGRIVLSSHAWSLPAGTRVRTEEDPEGVWSLHLPNPHPFRPERTISGLDPDEARRLRERIERWLDSGGAMPVESTAEVPIALSVAETTISIVSSRLSLVIPFLIATTGLLFLTVGWQLFDAHRGNGDPLPRMDREAEGELLEYRWVVYAPAGTEDAMNARAYLRIAIGYQAEDGVDRTLWLRTRAAPEVFRVPGELRRAGSTLGLPYLEFQMPEWAEPLLEPGRDWAYWRDANAELRHQPRFHATNLIGALDRPFEYLLAGWTAPPPDWRVSYSARSPDRAMPSWWADAERAAMEELSFRHFAPAGGFALLLIALTLPGVLSFGFPRWIGRIATLVIVLSIPWWAEYAERGASMIGAGDRGLDFASDVLRIGLPEASKRHAEIRRMRAPDDPERGITLPWDPPRSASAELLRALGLDATPDELPFADSASAVDYMRDRAAAALVMMSTEELDAFGEVYRSGEFRTQFPSMHQTVVIAAFCELTRRDGLDPDQRRALERTRSGPLEVGEPCVGAG